MSKKKEKSAKTKTETPHENTVVEKNLTLQGITIPHAVLILASIGIIGVSLYLTNHYFETFFPTKLSEGSVCDISAFWNCDVATFSNISNIFHVPISFFGFLFGLSLLFGTFFPTLSFERTNGLLSVINIVGVIFLALYSLIFLKGLCPQCFIYYILSGIVLYLFYKFGNALNKPDPRYLGGLAVLALVGSYFLHGHYVKKDNKESQVAKLIVKEFEALSVIGDPAAPSRFSLHKSNDDFNKAPLRISIFSDFQCPYCKLVEPLMNKISRRYAKSVNIQYFFFPLDSSCNPEVSTLIHPAACQAARLSICYTHSGKNFKDIHDEIFKRQDDLTIKMVNDWAKSEGLYKCLKAPQTNKELSEHMAIAKNYGLKSTPVMVINGVKIEGVLPHTQLFAILDHLIKKQ